MVVARAFPEGMCGVRFGADDNAAFFLVVVRDVEGRSERVAFCTGLARVGELVSEAECGGLHAAARRAQRTMRIPLNRVMFEIEVIVAAMVAQHERRGWRAFEIVERAAHDAVSAKIGFGSGEIAVDRALDEKRAMSDERALRDA